jgi:hypothetical protein
MSSGSSSTSTEYVRLASSSGPTGGNLKSLVALETALSLISSAMLFAAGWIVPMQPLSSPSFLRQTNTPAFLPRSSSGASLISALPSPLT